MARPSHSSRKPGDLKTIDIPDGVEVEGEIKLRAIETAANRKHRHRMEVREFWVKEAPVHLTAIAIVVGSMVLSLVVVFRPGSSVDDKKWAVSVLSYLLMAVAGFAFGKAAK
jgi:hypothetical protein